MAMHTGGRNTANEKKHRIRVADILAERSPSLMAFEGKINLARIGLRSGAPFIKISLHSLATECELCTGNKHWIN